MVINSFFSLQNGADLLAWVATFSSGRLYGDIHACGHLRATVVTGIDCWPVSNMELTTNVSRTLSNKFYWDSIARFLETSWNKLPLKQFGHHFTYLTRSNFVERETPFFCILKISLITMAKITVFTCKQKRPKCMKNLKTNAEITVINTSY